MIQSMPLVCKQEKVTFHIFFRLIFYPIQPFQLCMKTGLRAVEFCPPGYELATTESEVEKKACFDFIKCLKNTCVGFRCLANGRDGSGFWIGGNAEDSSKCMTGFAVSRSTVSDELKPASCTGFKNRRPLCQGGKCGETFKITLTKSQFSGKTLLFSA